MKYTKNIFEKNTSLIEKIIAKTENGKIKTITMGFPDIYGRYMGKKFDVDYFNGGIIKKGSNACNYLLGCDIEMNPVPNTQLSSYSLGYGDFTMLPDLNSLRKVNYINGEDQFLFFSDLIGIEKEEIIEYAPRQLLRRAEERLAKLGLKLSVECEINFTAFYEKIRKAVKDLSTVQPLTEHSNLTNVFYSQANEDFLHQLTKNFLSSGIPVKSIYGDSGLGQFKVCIGNTDSIEFSDNITLMKLVSCFIYFLD